MTKEKIYAFPNLPTPNTPIIFDSDTCNGCNKCIDTCQMSVLMPNPDKGKPPVVMYPDECWYCGCCVLNCPHMGRDAIKMNFPVMVRMRWKDKKTGQHYRFGMKNPPPPNTKPPVGGWHPKV